MTIRTFLKVKQDILNEIIPFEGNQSQGAVEDVFYDYKKPSSFIDDFMQSLKDKSIIKKNKSGIKLETHTELH